MTRYVAFLEKRTVPSSQHNEYKKWLRYYLEYCNKYVLPEGGAKSLSPFLGKLKEKKQTEIQIRQAGHAGKYYSMIMEGRISVSPEDGAGLRKATR